MKKHWINLLAAICLLPLCCSCVPDDPIPDGDYDISLLPGKWCQDGTQLYYRYRANGTGCTWDEADDISETEAQSFTWEVDGSEMIHIHFTETGTAQVPKYYILTELTSRRLSYHDAYVSSKKFSFTKVTE